MKLRELKPILNTEVVAVYVDGTVQTFYNTNTNNNEYIFRKDENINLWDVYGEYEIKQIYSDDEEDFNIELV